MGILKQSVDDDYGRRMDEVTAKRIEEITEVGT
jgi:hypothetical protein